jgi:ABC-type phosphate transport system substrate-binding protein
MMKKIVLAVVLASLANVCLAEIVVIVHPSNTAVVSEDDVTRLFLGKKNTFESGAKATPFYLAQGHDAVEEFNKKALGKSSSQLKAYWSKLIFTGKGTPPDALGNIEDVLARVASDPSAIAYIDAAKVTSNVKVVATYK